MLHLNYLKSLCILIYFLSFQFTYGQSNKVTIVQKEGAWQLLVQGKPFYIKGAGGQKQLDVLVAAGGNTIRTWGTKNADKILNEAHKRGLKVMLGLWVQHERHGFDYNNEAAVKAQLETFREEVRKYKDHPALLVWGIGNEYELEYSNTKVWAAVNDIAKMVHEEDPNHPTSTVTAGTNSEKLKFVMEELPEIDIYGINTYADIDKVKQVLESGGFDGPYMITEWGPTGHWESPKTAWGVAIEQTSKEKAASYLKRYKQCIEPEKRQCIGSFAFLWGQKQEYTSTWYGLFTEDQLATEAVDVLQFCWSGSYPQNRSPSIDKIKISIKQDLNNLRFLPKQKIKFKIVASDLNKDILQYNWVLSSESTDKKSGGDTENKPVQIADKIKGKNRPAIKLTAPTKRGAYRLFIFVDDGKKVAYLNIPFSVESLVP